MFKVINKKRLLIYIGMAGVARAKPRMRESRKGLFQRVLVEWQFFSMFGVLSLLQVPFDLEFSFLSFEAVMARQEPK